MVGIRFLESLPHLSVIETRPTTRRKEERLKGGETLAILFMGGSAKKFLREWGLAAIIWFLTISIHLSCGRMRKIIVNMILGVRLPRLIILTVKQHCSIKVAHSEL